VSNVEKPTPSAARLAEVKTPSNIRQNERRSPALLFQTIVQRSAADIEQFCDRSRTFSLGDQGTRMLPLIVRMSESDGLRPQGNRMKQFAFSDRKKAPSFRSGMSESIVQGQQTLPTEKGLASLQSGFRRSMPE